MFQWIQALDGALHKISIRYLGMGLLIAWVYCTWFAGNDETISQTLSASVIFSAAGLLALTLRADKRTPIKPAFILAAGITVSITTAAFSFFDQEWLCIAAAALGGAASSILCVAWGEMFCQIDQETAESCIPASLMAFFCAGATVIMLPTALGEIFSASMPFISCIMLLLGRNRQPESFRFPEPEHPFREMLLPLSKLALCSMACSIATGFIMASFSPTDLPADPNGQIPFYLAGGLAAMAVTIVAIAHTSRMNFSLLYEWAIPMIVFSLAFRIIGSPACNTASAVIACTAAVYAEVLFYAIFSRITSQRFCLPSEAFGLFRAFVQVGFLIGGAIGVQIAANQADPTHVCLALICACVVMLPLFLHLQKKFETPRTAGSCNGGDVAQPHDAITQIIDEFKLSARESEVLGYLGRGRSVPYMREAMTLSKSTIETHIKHIYAKTGVHSKQELLDLIESRQQ